MCNGWTSTFANICGVVACFDVAVFWGLVRVACGEDCDDCGGAGAAGCTAEGASEAAVRDAMKRCRKSRVEW